jgi:cobaltochelatase CobN
MHLLVTQSGTIDDGSEPRDLRQTPGDIVVLSSADSELMLLADAQGTLAAAGGQPSLRLANLMQLKHNYSVDLYAEKTLARARIVVLRVLGGKSYWPYGLEQLTEMARDGAFELVVLPGDERHDPMLEGLSTVDDQTRETLWAYLREGGPENARSFLEALAARLDGMEPPPSARPLLKAGLYWSGEIAPSLADIREHWREDQPVAALIFYRALVQSGDLAAADALICQLSLRGLNVLPIYVSSLRDPFSQELMRSLFDEARPDIILNSTAFAATLGDSAIASGSPFAGLDAMVLQVVFSGESEESWGGGTRGLSPHFIAMHVALPEVDGRVLTRAVSFKADRGFDEATQYYVTRSEPKPDRVSFVARLVANWVRLRRARPPERKIAVILANYPNRDSRLANGVGLDTPQSAIEVLKALKAQGYDAGEIPANGNALIEGLREGPTNATVSGRRIAEILPLNRYMEHFAALPEAVRSQIIERWGPPEDDPFFSGSGFVIPGLRFGNIFAGIQPARGYNIDPKGSYHDPALVPPHGYFAFYIWLRQFLRRPRPGCERAPDDRPLRAVVHRRKRHELARDR